MPGTLHITIDGKDLEYVCEHILTIGRSKTNDIPVVDPKVSRSHALVRRLGDGNYYLMDMGSANGTSLNSKRVLVPTALTDGDKLTIGAHEFIYRYEADDDLDDPDGAEHTHPTMVTMGGAIHQITVLVTDVRGYTSMSEKLPVDILARVMSSWFRVASEIVARNDGVVDKFIGDAIMVRWTDEPKDSISTVLSALKTAVEFNKELDGINAQFPDLPAPLKIGIGINSGQAVLGNVGGSSRDYTALGDSVNLAFRFESASKELGKDVVIGPTSCEQVKEELVKSNLQSIKVKGKEDPIQVCALTFDQIGDLFTDQ